MTENSGRQLAELRNLFGPPPVLSSEDRDHYDEMWDKLTECLNVKDFVELMFVTQVMNETWRISRYVRHDALAVERRFRQSLEFQAMRNKQRKERREAALRDLAEKPGRAITNLARLEELEDRIVGGVQDVDDILQRPPTEFDHNRALEAGIVFHEQLDKLITSAIARRNSALEQLELYRVCLGRHLREVSGQIIDATLSKVEEQTKRLNAPPLLLEDGSEPQASDASTEASGTPEGNVPPDNVAPSDASAASAGGNT
jgi:hypothetical protein